MSGPLRVWYGDSDIATVSNKSGILDENFKVENMFDENADTSWHSAARYTHLAKTMRVDFKVCNISFWGYDRYNFIQKPIDFVMLTIRKRKDCCFERYLNVCLVLNEDESDQLCTNTPDGFNDDKSPFITWYKPAKKVRTVELVFRDQHTPAQIADLKIFYNDCSNFKRAGEVDTHHCTCKKSRTATHHRLGQAYR